MSTTLDLRNLTEAQRNDAVNEAVALKIAGWKFKSALESSFDMPGIETEVWFDSEESYVIDAEGLWDKPKFATSADAVLPLLEKNTQVGIWWIKRKEWYVEIRNFGQPAPFIGSAKTLPLAACLALLKAHGVEVVT